MFYNREAILYVCVQNSRLMNVKVHPRTEFICVISLIFESTVVVSVNMSY